MLPNRWVKFKFGGIGTELYARDHVSNAQMRIGSLGMAIEDLGG